MQASCLHIAKAVNGVLPEAEKMLYSQGVELPGYRVLFGFYHLPLQQFALQKHELNQQKTTAETGNTQLLHCRAAGSAYSSVQHPTLMYSKSSF